MTLRFSTCEANKLLTIMVSGIFFILFIFWNIKRYFKEFDKRKLINTFLSIFLSNRCKEKTHRHRFVEILDKIMNPLKKCRIKKTYKTWCLQKVTLSDSILSWRGPYHTDTSPLICKANQWTGFYMIGVSVMKELTDWKKVKTFSFKKSNGVA